MMRQVSSMPNIDTDPSADRQRLEDVKEAIKVVRERETWGRPVAERQMAKAMGELYAEEYRLRRRLAKEEG